MSSIIQEFEARCRDAIRGATFFDQPVKDMNAESLLVFAGYLAAENTKLRKVAENAEVEKAHDWLKSLSSPRWIPVDERMPEPHVRCLIRERIPDPKEAIQFGTWLGERWMRHGGIWSSLHPSMVSHWMPLPSPPPESK